MAVIKIVPMPGAEGQKGDEGATGAQGPQGPIGETGPAGADALWSYNGAWQSNATYAEGDLVTHDGQLYYATGVTTLGVTPDLDSNFDLIAAKGETGSQGLQGPEAPSLITSGTWDPQFYEKNSIIPRLDGTLGHPLGPQSDYPVIANYYTIGDMVFFNFSVYLFDAIQWGAPITDSTGTVITDPSGQPYYPQFKFDLPFKHSLVEWTYSPLSLYVANNPSAISYRLGSGAPFIGRLIVRNDMEPAGFGDNEDYVIPVYGTLLLDNTTQKSYVAISSIDTEGLTDVNAGTFESISSVWPVDLISPSVTDNSKILRIHVSGTYRKE